VNQDKSHMLTSKVSLDEVTKKLSESFDYNFSGESSFEVPNIKIPDTYSTGLIVGQSGSGKSSILQQIGKSEKHYWSKDKAVCSHFKNADDAQEKFAAVGFNSVPSWFKPYQVLSTGEKFRVDLARSLKNGAVVDEFTSVVDRNVAKSCSNAVSSYIKRKKLKNVVFASCHYDIIDWLNPDWVYDTSTKNLTYRRSDRRPDIELELLPCGVEAWSMFSKHHYLTEDINKSAKFWLCLWESKIVGFGSAIAFPSGTVKNAYREHRTVVLPDYQGFGFGVRVSDAIAEIYTSKGCRYFSKTTHPRMGGYRNNSPSWKATSKNMKVRKDNSNKNAKWELRQVFSYSHEYIGACND